jgi:MFS family permease
VTARARKGWTASVQNRGWPVVLLLAVQLLSGIVLLPQRSFFPIYLEEQLRYTTVFVSALVAVGQLLGMIASVIGGALCDALGRKWTLVLGLIGFVLGSLAYLIRAPWLVILLWALSGLGLGFHTLGGQSYLIDAAGSERLGVLSALYHWGFTVGGALGSPGAGVILDSRGFAAFGLILLSVSLTTALAAMAFLPRLRTSEVHRNVGGLRGYADVIRRPVVVLLGLLRLLPTCYWGMATVLIPLLINRMAGSKTAVALYATFSQIMASLAQILAGRAADRWGRRPPTLMAFGALVVAAAGLAGFATHLWSFYTFGVLGACAAWSLSTLMPCLVSDATAVEERGRVLGTISLLWNMGMIVGSLIGGALVETAVGLPFLVAALLNLGAIALAVSFFRLVSH